MCIRDRIIHRIPNPKWVAEYLGKKFINPYLYRVAYSDENGVANETRDSVYSIILDPPNKFRPYPTHKTYIPETRWFPAPELLSRLVATDIGEEVREHYEVMETSLNDENTSELYFRHRGNLQRLLEKEFEAKKSQAYSSIYIGSRISN